MPRIIVNCPQREFPRGAQQLMEKLLESDPLRAQQSALRISAIFSAPEIAALNEKFYAQTRVGIVQCSLGSGDEPLTFIIQDDGQDTRLTTAFKNYMETRPGVFTPQKLVAGEN